MTPTGKQADPDQITLAGQTEGATRAVESRAKIVFLGVNVTWRARLGDLDMNSRQAADWEDGFGGWSIDGRSVRLFDRPTRYRVDMKDGDARFMLDGLVAQEVALSHITDLLERLREEGRSSVRVVADAQLLKPMEHMQFSELVAATAPKLLNEPFVSSQLGELEDYAYLVDVLRNDVSHQVNVGPVRRSEIRRRVSAEIIDYWPEVAVFASVTARYPQAGDEDFEVESSMVDLFEFSVSVVEGLVI